MIRRPGYLSDFAGGKSDYEPPPAPPPGVNLPPKKLTHAYNKKTQDYYLQDQRCSEGERTWKCSEKKSKTEVGCEVNECCELAFQSGSPFGPVCIIDPEECDHPDTPTECDDDPDYVAFPEGNYKSCQEAQNALRAAGVPQKLISDYCNIQPAAKTAAISKKRSAVATKCCYRSCCSGMHGSYPASISDRHDNPY